MGDIGADNDRYTITKLTKEWSNNTLLRYSYSSLIFSISFSCATRFAWISGGDSKLWDLVQRGGVLTFSLDQSLDRDSRKDDTCADPLASSKFVVVHDYGEEHRKEFPR